MLSQCRGWPHRYSSAVPQPRVSNRSVRSYHVYIIEITRDWYPVVADDLPIGKRCFYVGQTEIDVADRFKEHRNGKSHIKGRAMVGKPKAPFRRMLKENRGRTLRRKRDVVLRRTMMKAYRPTKTDSASRRQEARAIDVLRAEGHKVFPKTSGSIPFVDYRRSDLRAPGGHSPR